MSEKRVVVASFIDAVGANLAKSRLEDEGIRAFLLDDGSVSVMPMLTNALGGVKVQVLESDVERANAILGQSPNETISTPEDGEEAPLNIREKKVERALKGAILGVALLPLQLYILWILLDVALSREPLRPAKHLRI